MKRFYYTFILILTAMSLIAQDRYLDAMFDVAKESNIEFGTNITIITGTPEPQNLMMDVYYPVGDVETDKPLMIICPTGSFLPIAINGTTTGTRTDSTVVEVATRLASRGYVAAIIDYRQGWLPISPDPDIRKGTLLQAAYRGIQDVRTAVRYFRKSIDEGNSWGIQSDRIGAWGIGTGGYLALGAGSVDELEEVTLPKFRDQNNNALVDTNLLGNLYATTQKPLCLPNHVGYSSDIVYSFNAGGALGDSSWLDGRDDEPIYNGVHCTQDAFAPYYNGLVIVPTTMEIVVEVAGTRLAIQKANDLGSNDAISGLGIEDDELYDLIEAQKAKQGIVQGATQPINVVIGTDNFYGFELDITVDSIGQPQVQGSPWDWWGYQDFVNLVDFINNQQGSDLDADMIHNQSLRTNPDMSAEKAHRYLDTIFMLSLPRMYLGMDLGDAIVSTKDYIDPSEVDLEMFPNPADESVTIRSSSDTPIRSISVFNRAGLLVETIPSINSNQYELQKPTAWEAGMYICQVRFDSGVVGYKLIFN